MSVLSTYTWRVDQAEWNHVRIWWLCKILFDIPNRCPENWRGCMQLVSGHSPKTTERWLFCCTLYLFVCWLDFGGAASVDGDSDGRTSPRPGITRGGVRIGLSGRGGRGAMDRNSRGGPMMRGRSVIQLVFYVAHILTTMVYIHHII